jgi:hypothetical protein
MVTGTQFTAGQAMTLFTAESNQQSRIIGFWQATPQGLFLNWGRSSGGAATAPAPPPPALAAEQPGGPAPAAGDKDAEITALKRRLAEMEAGKAPAATPEAAAVPETMAPALAPANIPLRPLEKSEIVTKGPNGELGVAKKDGTPIAGFKLSQHDMLIGSPSIVVAPDGVIHVAFVEQHSTTFAYAIYHRSSADGGKTWTEAKNLSEDMPNIAVGRCQVLADSGNRVYVIWRAGFAVNWAAAIYPHSGGTRTNLWFRVLEGGKWSKIKPIHPPGTPETQGYAGSISYFAAVDAAGHAQVLWNTTPDQSHPEVVNPVMGNPHWLYNGIGNGQVFQAALDGSSVSAPREVFMPVVGGLQEKEGYCDGLDTLNGYVDSAGAAHFVAAVLSVHNSVSGKSRYEVIENGKAGQIIDLPELSFHAWYDMPTLLVDAKGRQHVIALYIAGEHPNFRDYLIGSDDEPTVILAAKGIKGICDGFQAYQGPGGRMAVIMQTRTGDMADLGDTWVSMSDGTQWSPPVCVTNNAARQQWASVNTGAIGSVGHGTAYHPGPGAAAFDYEGHLVLVLVNGKRGSFGSSIGGVLVASGSSESPMLFFYRF